MTFKTVLVEALGSDVNVGNTVLVAYPAGTNQAAFLPRPASPQGVAIVGGNEIFYEASGQVAMSFGALSITVTNSSPIPWLKGASLRLQLDQAGDSTLEVEVLSLGQRVDDLERHVVADVPSLLANTSLTYSVVTAGYVIETRAEGFRYRVAASGASDHDVITAGGVKLYARPVAGVLNAASITGSGGEVERLRIDASGNVGIGRTPACALDVQSASGAFARLRAATGNSAGYFVTLPGSDTSMMAFADRGATTGGTAGQVASIYTGTSVPLIFEVSDSEKMRIDASGNVGIGTSSPGAKLDVAGSIRGAAGGATLQVVDAGDLTLNASNAAGQIAFRTAGAERLRIDSSGNVGIGNTSPVVPLHVTGASMTTGVVYQNQPAQTSKGAAATLTIAELLTSIIQYTGAAANLTLPTGTAIEGGLPATFPTDMSFDFSVINTGSGAATVVTNTGLTTVGNLVVAAGESGMFRVRKTAANTFTVYRIS